jgi:surface antigen
MYNAIKVVLFTCLLFIATSVSAHALETSQLALQSSPFSASSASIIAHDPIIDDAEESADVTDANEDQPAPEGEPTTEVKPEPKPLTHVVKQGENLSQIAEQYNTTWNRLFAKNVRVTDPNIISVGETLTIPAVEEALDERAAPQVAPAVHTTAPATTTYASAAPASPRSYATTAGNTYAAGYCTWYAKNRRPDLPNMLGNAASWVASAAARGYAIGTAPRVGAIGQQGNHVVYVESVNSNGTVSISEMNYGGRLFVVNYRTVPAGSFVYIY